MAKLPEILAQNLRHWRQSRGLSQEALAERAGISLGAVRTIEACSRWPGIETVEALARALDVSDTVLFSSANLVERPGPSPLEALETLAKYVRARESLPRVKREIVDLITAMDEAEMASDLAILRESLLARALGADPTSQDASHHREKGRKGRVK